VSEPTTIGVEVGSANVVVSGCTVTGATTGVSLTSAGDYAIVSDCSLDTLSVNGVAVGDGAVNAVVAKNTISNVLGVGVSVGEYSVNCGVVNNTLRVTGGDGIHVGAYSHGARIQGNFLSEVFGSGINAFALTGHTLHRCSIQNNIVDIDGSVGAPIGINFGAFDAQAAQGFDVSGNVAGQVTLSAGAKITGKADYSIVAGNRTLGEVLDVIGLDITGVGAVQVVVMGNATAGGDLKVSAGWSAVFGNTTRAGDLDLTYASHTAAIGNVCSGKGGDGNDRSGEVISDGAQQVLVGNQLRDGFNQTGGLHLNGQPNPVYYANMAEIIDGVSALALPPDAGKFAHNQGGGA